MKRVQRLKGLEAAVEAAADTARAVAIAEVAEAEAADEAAGAVDNETVVVLEGRLRAPFVFWDDVSCGNWFW